MKKAKILFTILVIAIFIALLPNIVKAAEVTVSFTPNGGNDIPAQTVESGEKATKPTDPTREGYVFMGWSKDVAVINETTGEKTGDLYDFETPVTDATVLVANWAKNYTVKFYAKGITSDEEQTVRAGNTPNLPSFANQVIDGYRVIGFYYDEGYSQEYNGQSITDNTDIYVKWEHTIVLIRDELDDEDDGEITEVYLTVEPPKPGDEATIVEDSDSYTGYNWSTARPKLDITVPDDANYYIDDEYEDESYNYWLMSLEDDDYNNPFTGIFEAGKSYIAEIEITAEDGYYFSEDVKVYVNGVEVDKIFYNDYDFISVGATLTIPLYEYEMLKGADQEFDKNGDDLLTFEADIDFSKFQESGKVYVDDEEVDSSNYTATEGSTIITFTKEFSKGLTVGEHSIRIAVADGEAKADFTVKTNNPATGDNISLFVLVFTIATLGIILTIRKYK